MTEYAAHLLKNPPEITMFVIMDYMTEYALRNHICTRHELIYILDGALSLHLGKNQIFEASPGDLLLIPSGTVHRDDFTIRGGLRVLYINFEWDEPEYFQTVNNAELAHLNYEIRCEVQRRLEFMRLYWEKTPVGLFHATFQLHGILQLLYFGVMNSRRSDHKEPLTIKENMQLARRFIIRNHASPLTLEDVSKFIGINPTYFSQQFSREFGISFSAYLTATRLEYAKHMLLNSSKQVAEVADLCGFNSSGYFIKVFRKHFGMPPKAYISAERKKVDSHGG